MATGRVFTANVVMSRNAGGEVTEFKIGDDVPQWAMDRVGDHVSQGTTRAADAPVPVDPGVDTPVDPETPEEVVEEEDSYADWTKEALKDEAKAREIEGISKMSKDELIAALEADDEE